MISNSKLQKGIGSPIPVSAYRVGDHVLVHAPQHGDQLGHEDVPQGGEVLRRHAHHEDTKAEERLSLQHRRSFAHSQAVIESL